MKTFNTAIGLHHSQAMSIFTLVRVFITSRIVQNGRIGRVNTDLENFNESTGKGLNIVQGSELGIAVWLISVW